MNKIYYEAFFLVNLNLVFVIFKLAENLNWKRIIQIMFELRDLFGGAICTHMPDNAVDIRFVVTLNIN
jgi:hypothetical protein